MMHIIIIHYKHWLLYMTQPVQYDCTQPGQKKGTFYSISGFWLSHHGEMWLSQKNTRIMVCFCTNATRILASKCHRNMIKSMICRTAKTLLQAQKDYKRLFVFFLTLQLLLCKFKLYKKTHWLPLKIDKRDNLLKVDVLSDAEWLFGVTPKGTCSEK